MVVISLTNIEKWNAVLGGAAGASVFTASIVILGETDSRLMAPVSGMIGAVGLAIIYYSKLRLDKIENSKGENQ